MMDAFVTMKCDWKVLGHFLFGRDACHIVFSEVLAWERFPPRLGRKEGLKVPPQLPDMGSGTL